MVFAKNSEHLSIGSSRIFCPFPAEVHPDGSAIESQLLAWAERHRLVTSAASKARFVSARFGACAALTYPRASDLPVLAKWLVWLFMLDDQFDENIINGQTEEARRMVSEILRIFEKWTKPLSGTNFDNPFLASLCDTLEGIANLRVSTSWKRRFISHACSYVTTYCSDTANSRHSGPLDLASYRALRRDSGAVETCIDLIEASICVDLSKYHENHRRVLPLREAANDIICWTNDIFSLEKELAHGEMNNIVAVLRGEGSETWEHATGRALKMIEKRTLDFLDVKSELIESCTTKGELLNYVTGIENWISGSLRWHQESRRYRLV